MNKKITLKNEKELENTKAAASVLVIPDEEFLVNNVLKEDSEVKERLLNFKYILLNFKQILDKALLEGISSDEDLKNLQRELEKKT